MEDLKTLGKYLNEISTAVLFEIQTRGVASVLDEATRHQYRDDWTRISIRKELLEPWRGVVDIDVMAVEVIIANSMDTDVHYHNDAYAVITILGEREGTPEPVGGLVYFKSKDKPFDAVSGVTIQVLPGVIHGFRSPKGSNPVTILSVQSKRIDEDFFVA